MTRSGYCPQPQTPGDATSMHPSRAPLLASRPSRSVRRGDPQRLSVDLREPKVFHVGARPRDFVAFCDIGRAERFVHELTGDVAIVVTRHFDPHRLKASVAGYGERQAYE